MTHNHNPASESSQPPTRLPANHESFGVVHDPHPDLKSLLAGEDPNEITRHACRVADGDPLCEADADAPVFPFRGKRSEIRAGLENLCPACRDQLRAIAEQDAPQQAGKGPSRGSDRL